MGFFFVSILSAYLLTLFIMMDYPIHIFRISMKLSILYFKGLSANFSIKWCFSVPEDCFYLSRPVLWGISSGMRRRWWGGVSSGSSLFAKVPRMKWINSVKKKIIVAKLTLSYDVASGSEITTCNKIDKPLVVYRFTGNVMTSITMLCT